MYLIISNYVVPATEVDPHRTQHADWVNQYLNSGEFIIAGPRRGRNGGVILTRSIEKARLLEILNEDSFVSENLVETQIVDFDGLMIAESFKNLQNL
jgi:uncharacterized protein YciI